jgi:hypothetical protein
VCSGFFRCSCWDGAGEGVDNMLGWEWVGCAEISNTKHANLASCNVFSIAYMAKGLATSVLAFYKRTLPQGRFP